MVALRLPSLRLLLFGVLIFVLSLAVLYAGAPRSEASLLTRVIVFGVLIPTPVLFAAGIFLSVAREPGTRHVGAWANAAGIFLHGAASIAAMHLFFA